MPSQDNLYRLSKKILLISAAQKQEKRSFRPDYSGQEIQKIMTRKMPTEEERKRKIGPAPDELADDANVQKTFQNLTGTYINRKNNSEGPDDLGNKEQNLLNGGVHAKQSRLERIKKGREKQPKVQQAAKTEKAKNKSVKEEKTIGI